MTIRQGGRRFVRLFTPCNTLLHKTALAFLLVMIPAIPIRTNEVKAHEPSSAINVRVEDIYSRLPLYFIQNKGEADKRVVFYEKGGGHSTFFTKDGVYLNLYGDQRSVISDQRLNAKHQTLNTKHQTPDTKLIKLSFISANKNPEIIGEGLQEGKVNYFIGNDPKRWKTDMPTYEAIVYKEVYPGIDIKFYGNNRQMEYDIIVKPGADPSPILFSYEGIKGIRVTEEGDLEIELTLTPPSPAGGEGRKGGEKIIQKRPYIYQEIDGKKVEVAGRFKILNEEVITLTPPSPLEGEGKGEGESVYGFDVVSYDKRHPLIIDPILVYSTYLGGSGNDYGVGIAVDSLGNAYLTGFTQSTDFKTQRPLQSDLRDTSEAFVVKLNPAWSALIYSTYLGGSKQDRGHAIAVDSSGSVYIAGVTNSEDFPTVNPLQPAFGGNYDAFVSKLDPAGSILVYSTYLGGNDSDGGLGIAVDSSGGICVTGETASTNFPTVNPLQPAFGGGFSDAFVSKFNPSGSALVYSTYLGGIFQESGYAIAVDPSGNAYVTGDTRSANFPTKNPLQPTFDIFGGYDAFVTKLNPRGTLIYSTFLGGNNHDEAYAIAVDPSGNAYVTGETRSTNFPIKNPLQPVLSGLNDVFVAKFNPSGSALVYSTYLGGSGFDEGSGITIDPFGNAYVTGKTNSTNFPTSRPLQPISGGRLDAFVTKINPEGSALVYSTYLGGSENDEGRGIVIDPSGNAYLIGMTSSINFPIKNPLQATSGGKGEAFVAKISDTRLAGEKR